ncbi:sensor histidine kinase [Joostella sp.]|uniref:sensor histidine kinase n=1 Tax=Joostella sp. TaxID=2231138 RepID=UPI003A8F6698
MIYRVFLRRIVKEKNKLFQSELDHQKNLRIQYSLVQENERKQIANLLHDHIGSKLNILSLWIDNEDTWSNKNSRAVIENLVPKLINETRSISHELYPVSLERFGLILTIEELLSNIELFFKIQFFLAYPYQKKERLIEIQIYRIVQEFISNVVKHAQASEVKLYLRDSANAFSIVLADNGIGFNLSEIKRGMGINNIETRLKSIEATWKWKSDSRKGTRLIILIYNS